MLFSAFFVAACDDGGERPPSDSDAADTTADTSADTSADTTADSDTVAAVPRVTLAYAFGGRGDESFNDMAAAGLDRAKGELTFVADEIDDLSGNADAVAALQEAATQSALVIGVGFQLGELFAEVAPEFPGVHFAILDGDGPPLDNVSWHQYAAEEGSFLVGAAAGLTSKTGEIGYIGGVGGDDFPLLKPFEAGFVAGVKHVAPSATVDVVYLSQFPEFIGFADPEGAHHEALRQYGQGCDVIYHAAGGSGFGLFQAAQEVSAAGDDVWAIGVDTDQYLLVDAEQQPYVLTSMLKRLDTSVYRLVTALVGGDDLPSGVVVGDLAGDYVGYATSGGHVDAIKAQLDAIAADIVDGTITVPKE